MDHENCMPSKGCCCGSCAGEHGDQRGCNSGGMLKISMEDGQELQCRIIRIFRVSETDYIALQPVRTNEVLIFRYISDEGGTIHLDNIQSGEEFDQASEVFNGFYK